MSIVLSVNLEVCLRMEADGTDVGGFGADDDVAAVAAFPDADTRFAEHLGSLDVAQQGTVAFLVVLLDGCYATELLCQFVAGASGSAAATFTKSEAGCLQMGQVKSSGRSSPTYS